MTLLGEYYDRRKVGWIIPEKPKQILFGILEDLLDRRGLKHEFMAIDEDIQEEILQTWLEIIAEVVQ